MVNPLASLRIKFFAIVLLAIGVLWLATAVALHTSAKAFTQSHIRQMHARLDVADELIEQWRRAHLRSMATITKLAGVNRWAAAQLALPKGQALRNQDFAQMRQLYVQQGYHGHVLFDQQHALHDDSNNGIHQKVVIPPPALAVLEQAAQDGVAISNPYPAPLHLQSPFQSAGTPMYLLCARLLAPSQGSLCLHFDQTRGMAKLLSRASHPQYGKLYAQGLHTPQRQSGYIEHQAQGIATLTRWNPVLRRSLVLEMPLEVLYAPYYLARTVVLSLGVLASVLIGVMLLLSLRHRERFADRNALYRQLLDQLPLQVRVRDVQGNMHLQNQLAADSPYAIAADLPLNHAPPTTPLDQQAWALQRRVKQQQRVQVENVVNGVHTDAHFYALLMIGFPIFNPKGKLIALGNIAINQTEQVRTQHALEHLTKALEQQVLIRTAELADARDVAESAARAKADFLANMSHELRSPLSAVIGLVHLAERSNQDQQVGAYLQRISSSAGHLQEVINDILDFSKIDAGKLQIERTPFDPERLLESVADIIWDKAQRKQLSVLFDIDPRVPKQLYGDPLRLSQVLINFADNAIKFTPQGMVAVRIRVLADQSPHWQLCFEVQDSGIGIPNDYFEHIFQPFEQLDNSVARQHGGTGLGLPICRHLAKLMNAELEVRSQPGLGSVFSLTLTLEQASEQDAHHVQPINARRALLVDAKSPSRASLKAKLEALGLTVSTCATAAQAQGLLKQNQTQPYQLLLLDWDLPDMPAQQLAARIHAEQLAPDSHLVLLSARGTAQLLPHQVLQHFAAVLDKPVSPQRLRETVLRLEQDLHKPSFVGRRILLVEDELINQEVACELLQALGIAVSLAQNGEQALNTLAQDDSIELVLMDIQMPVLDGLSTMRLLRKRYPQLPVIALTGNGLPGDRERCLAAGMNDYLAKPFQPDELNFMLSRWLPAAAAPQTPPRIHHFNSVQALERLLGNEALYERLLRRFSQDYADFSLRLTQAVQNEGHRHGAEMLHSFKSLAATIGAEQLQHIAQQTECVLRLEQCTHKQVAELSAELNLVLEHIDRYLVCQMA